MNIKFQPFHCSGFVQTEISDSDLDSLGDIIKSADKTKQSYLAGIQTDNWMIPEAQQVLEPYIRNLVTAYSQTYVEFTDEYEREIGKVVSPKYKIDSLNLDEIWVNITEKYMYNPPHNHQGCLLYTSPSPRDGLLSRMPSSA